MPLSPPASRQRLHVRRVVYEGFQRDDGLFDIEARITDVKDHDAPLTSGTRKAGESLHDMAVRVTIDRRFHVHAVEVVTDAMPYPGACDSIGPAYGKLVGANLARGFRQRLKETMGGVQGCTHVTEMLHYLPTAAMQTFAGLQREDQVGGKPFQLDRCHALDSGGDTVRTFYPQWYRGGAARPA